MSDEIPHDEWLTPSSRDMEEVRRADEMETFLAALMRASADGSIRPAHPNTVSVAAETSDEHLATMLVEVGEGLVPDADFAATLQAQLERRIRGRSGDSAGTTSGADGPGAPETSNSAGSPHGHATRFQANGRRYLPLWAAMAALLLLSLLLALPVVRASLRQPLCLGSVCVISPGSPQPTTSVPASPMPTPLPSVLDLAGRTTLAQARGQAGFPVRLPAYPADLGQPNYVFLQDLDGVAVLLVWADHAHPNQPRLSLSELSSGIFVYKFSSEPVAVTTVHGQQALWTTGPYMVELRDGAYVTRRLVTGHALVWTEGAITYRLETSLPLEEAVRIAESLR